MFHDGILFYAEATSVLYLIKHQLTTASLSNGFKNENSLKILKIDLVLAVDSSKKFIGNGKRVYITYKDTPHETYIFIFVNC